MSDWEKTTAIAIIFAFIVFPIAVVSLGFINIYWQHQERMQGCAKVEVEK